MTSCCHFSLILRIILIFPLCQNHNIDHIDSKKIFHLVCRTGLLKEKNSCFQGFKTKQNLQVEYKSEPSFDSVLGIVFSGRSRISRRGHVDLVGGVDSRGSYISKILYVETKESGPLGGGLRAGHAP